MGMFPDRDAKWPLWIERQLVQRGITDERVLRAFADVKREAFVGREYQGLAYDDGPLPIGCRQTISQPYVVALSLQALRLTGTERVLDIGTGSGYQAVLLSHLAAEVYTIEVIEKLFFNARLVVPHHQRAPVHLRLGDGSLGWPEAAPFHGIVVGACSPKLPRALADQLAPGGRLVIPIGSDTAQGLYCFTKSPSGALSKVLLEQVTFVPLVGEQGTGARVD